MKCDGSSVGTCRLLGGVSPSSIGASGGQAKDVRR